MLIIDKRRLQKRLRCFFSSSSCNTLVDHLGRKKEKKEKGENRKEKSLHFLLDACYIVTQIKS